MASSFIINIPFLLILFLTTHTLSDDFPRKPTDTDALTIFRSTADAHGILAANWTTLDACTGRWLGVACSPDGRVTSLSLPSLDLRGPLDPLFRLDQLRLLDLHSNHLNGTLLPLLPSLPNLKLLYLSGNDLSGSIPSAIGRLDRLLRVDLSDNALSGPIPAELSNLTRLLTLRIQNNLLSGLLPNLTSSMPHLAEFNACNNQFSGEAPLAMLAKFGPTSVAGNADLCGSSPPLLLCNGTTPPHPVTAVVPSNPSSIPGSPDAIRSEPEEKGRRANERRLSRATITGIIVGNVVFLLVLISLFLACCCCRGSSSNTDLRGLGNGKVVEQEGDGDSYSFEGGKKVNKEARGRSSDESEGAAAAARNKLMFFEDSGDSGENSTRKRPRRRFELEELLRASAEMVGKGSLGTVYRAVLEDGRMVAVKRLRDAGPCSLKEFNKYMDLIGRVSRHPNLLPLRAYYFAKEEKLLIYDFLPNGSLHSLLHNRGQGRSPLDWTTRIGLALGAARGLARIHEELRSPGIAHGSVKSSNVLLDKNGAARVSDFGLAQLSPAHIATRLGGYRAPEQSGGSGKRLSQEADVYSFGVLLLEILTGRAPTQYPSPPPVPAKKGGSGGTGAIGLNLPEWVRSVVREEWTAEVFDPELMRYKKAEDEMVVMLQVALACVAQRPDQRPTMLEVVRMIEDIRVDQSPLEEEEDEDKDLASLAATTEDGRLSYVTDG